MKSIRQAAILELIEKNNIETQKPSRQTKPHHRAAELP